MKIIQISQINTISFNAGKTTIFSDFDGTYMAFKHSDVCSKNHIFSQIKSRDYFNKIFQNYTNFMKKAQQDIEFIITTGRSKFEYTYFIDKIKELGLFYQSPSKLITRDGNDYYNIHDEKFLVNKERLQNIEQQTNWNKSKIENDLKSILNKNFKDICFINTPINKNEYDYGNLSLEYALKALNNKDRMNYVSFTSGDNLFLEIALAENIDIQKVHQIIKKYVKENNIKAKINMYSEDQYTYLPQYEKNGSYKFKPGRIIRMNPVYNNEPLTKLYDVRQEVEFNIKNKTDNFVIAIGDASNDESMLNPLNYLSIYGYNHNKNYKEILEDNEALNLLAQLPFATIITGDSKSLDGLRNLGRELEKRGIKKIYTAKNQDQGYIPQLKKAISDYGAQNSNFKYSMNTDLFEEIISGDYKYDS